MFDVDSLINTISLNKELISKPQYNPFSSQPEFCQGDFASFCVMEGGGWGGGGGGGCYCGGHTLVNFSLHTTQSVQILQINSNSNHPGSPAKYPGNWKKLSTFPNLSTNNGNGRSCLTVLLLIFFYRIGRYLNHSNVLRFSQFSEYRGIWRLRETVL